MPTRTWEPLPPCSDCMEIVEQLNRRMPQLYQSMGAETVIGASFYPDANPETTTVDGLVRTFSAIGTTWNDIRTGPGTGADDTSVTLTPRIRCDTNVNKWDSCQRGVALFDLSDYGEEALVSAELILRGQGTPKKDDFGDNALVLISATLASDTALALGDFDNFGTTEYATRIPFAMWDIYGANSFHMNGDGMEFVTAALGGICRFGFKISDDFDNTEPTWGSADVAEVVIASSENTNYSGPKLVLRFRE